jgi:hypothetical protein
MTAPPPEAPLTNYRITGYVERWHEPLPGVKQPSGSCWHCGTGIAICVQIRHISTDEIHEIGTTCAERTGLDTSQLRAMLAERHADERHQRFAAEREAIRRAAAEQDAANTAAHGVHGTTSRFSSGCRCDLCRPAAPHGTLARFLDGPCHCGDCIGAAAALDDYTTRELDLIVDLVSGEIVEDARKVTSRYGTRWCIHDGEAWLPVRPARRSTMAKRGYVEAKAPYLVEICGRHQERWYKPVVQLGRPVFDSWGEPIPHPTPAAPQSSLL